jgi:uncharacterized protein (DUF983 family)
MRRMVTHCPNCGRGGVFRQHWLADAEVLLWRCHYCGCEWTAGARKAAPAPEEGG